MARHTEKPKFPCKLCDFVGPTSQALGGHVSTKHHNSESTDPSGVESTDPPGVDRGADSETLLGGTTMSRIVESSKCPTCGTKHDSIKKFEVAEVPVVDQEGVGKILSGFEELKNLIGTSPGGVDATALRASLAHNTKVLDQLAAGFIRHPKPTEAFIKETWEECPECKVAWEEIVNKIRAQAASPHVVTSEHVKDCPECQKVIADMLQPPAPAPAPPEPAPAEAAGGEVAAAAAGEAAPAEGSKPAEATEKETKWPWEDKKEE